MAIVLYNPTDKIGEFGEIFNGHYMGRGINIKPGDKIKVLDAAAKHLLTEFGSRGLIALEYGDNEEMRAEEGLANNRAFKVKQINKFNEENEARKHTGLRYNWPSDKIKAYAKEIGVKLTESYKIDDVQVQASERLIKENQELRDMVMDQNKRIEQMMNVMMNKMGGNQGDTSISLTNDEIPVTKSGKPDGRYKKDKDQMADKDQDQIAKVD